MSRISRRHFLRGAATAGGAAAFAGRWTSAAEQAPTIAPPEITSGVDVVTLGRSQIKSTVLGIGTGTRGGREQRELGQDGFTRLVRHALDQGVRYVDTADAYRTHEMVRAALKGVPREQYFIQTKTRAKAAEAAKADIERFRQELDLPCLDTLLVHCMTRRGWPVDMRPVMDVLYDAKEKERVKAVGVSCHGFDPLEDSAGCDWVDVHLVRINPFSMKMDGEPDKVAAQMQKMYQQGHGVLGMKIFGETGYDSPEKRREALEYVLGLGCVHAFTIGFTSTEQVDETLKMIEQAAAATRDKLREAA